MLANKSTNIKTANLTSVKWKKIIQGANSTNTKDITKNKNNNERKNYT